MVTSGWFLKIEEGTLYEILALIRFLTASALRFPIAIKTILRAFMMDFNPMVTALVGASCHDEQRRELSLIVDSFKSAI